jgi:hypothetical protein
MIFDLLELAIAVVATVVAVPAAHLCPGFAGTASSAAVLGPDCSRSRLQSIFLWEF